MTDSDTAAFLLGFIIHQIQHSCPHIKTNSQYFFFGCKCSIKLNFNGIIMFPSLSVSPEDVLAIQKIIPTLDILDIQISNPTPLRQRLSFSSYRLSSSNVNLPTIRLSETICQWVFVFKCYIRLPNCAPSILLTNFHSLFLKYEIKSICSKGSLQKKVWNFPYFPKPTHPTRLV